MEQPTKARRRRRRNLHVPFPVATMPAWKRALAAAFFLGAGGGSAIWGLGGVASWVASLHRGDPVILTENFVLGFCLLGAGLFAIGPEFIVPHLLATWSDRLRTRAAGLVLGLLLAGVVFVLLGQVVINVVMEMDGYRACRVGGRGRVTEVTWARGDVDCPGKAPDG